MDLVEGVSEPEATPVVTARRREDEVEDEDSLTTSKEFADFVAENQADDNTRGRIARIRRPYCKTLASSLTTLQQPDKYSTPWKDNHESRGPKEPSFFLRCRPPVAI